jgi:error-prone DNA polymerase
MAQRGISGEAAEQIITSIVSFALYGFPESHAASFALLAYASAYLKVNYPAAFYTALLNNQPMGFYHPATLVKDAQRRGVRFHPIDVQLSDWDCIVEPDGGVRLGLRYVNGLREQAGRAIALSRPSSLANGRSPSGRSRSLTGSRSSRQMNISAAPFRSDEPHCPKCGCDDESMLEPTADGGMFCNVCSHHAAGAGRGDASSGASVRFTSVDDLVSRASVRRDELVTLADIGALTSLGYDRRSALWQAERAVRPSGALFASIDRAAEEQEADALLDPELVDRFQLAGPGDGEDIEEECPLKPMTEGERLTADYAGTGLTIGRHPMALRRDELAMRGVLRASDLHAARSGRRVRVAGMVITRQRPGTAKGFVFLTLEDETGIANIIVRPDLFARDRLTVVEEKFLIIDGVLQIQDGVVSVRAEQVQGFHGGEVDFDAHDFY